MDKLQIGQWLKAFRNSDGWLCFEADQGTEWEMEHFLSDAEIESLREMLAPRSKAQEGEAGAVERIAGGLDLEGAKRFVAERNWVPKSYFLSMAAEIDALRAKADSDILEAAGIVAGLRAKVESLEAANSRMAEGIQRWVQAFGALVPEEAKARMDAKLQAGAAVPAREALRYLDAIFGKREDGDPVVIEFLAATSDDMGQGFTKWAASRARAALLGAGGDRGVGGGDALVS